jgi:hypothetical protein
MEDVQILAQSRWTVRNSLHVIQRFFQERVDFRLTLAVERATLAALP